MQSIAGYPTDLTVTEPSALVTVNGTPQDVSSVTVTRELSSSMPAQVTSASGITAATGSVEWVVGKDVETRSAHPWDGNEFPPKPADDVVVFMGYGPVMARQLTGAIDSTNGSIADGAVSSDVVDPIDKLNRPVTFPPFMGVMPPWEEGGDFLAAGSEPTFFTDRVLRACGFNATPPVTSLCVFSAPLMGSAWPEIGKLTQASQQGFPAFPPSFGTSHWGMAANSIDATYEPDVTPGSGRLDRTVQLTAKVRKVTASSGNTVFQAWWGSARISLAFTPDRLVRAHVNDNTTDTIVCTMFTGDAWSADTFTLRVTPAGVFTIFANNGATATGNATLPGIMGTTDLSSVVITSPHITGMHLGGLQVNWGATAVYNAAQTAALTPAAYSFGLPAFPALDGRNALEVLKEQAEAECAAIWIDEFGVFRWVNRDVLTGAAAAATLTALDDVLDVGWESDANGVRAGVSVKSRQAKITRFPTSAVTLHQGSGESLQSNEITTDIVEPGADESWFSINLNGWTHAQLNRGQMTMQGGVVSKDGVADVWAPDAGKLHLGATMLSTEKLLLTHTAGTLASGETVVLKTSETDGLLRPFRRDKNLPIIRGKGRVRWTDIVTTSTITGPEDASWLEHDAGPWVQDPDALQELADWLGGQVSAPRPVLRDLRVVPDFRRQLGDVVWVEDPDNMRIQLKLLLTKVSTTVSGGSAEQTIAGRILEVLTYGPTNNQLDNHAEALTNTGFDILWADATNAELDLDPTGRG